ncbi:MAG: hypothetical protein HFJ34_01265 [Clostridia bacterium]|nr:hypothetical protein [Clostridia bacterium]
MFNKKQKEIKRLGKKCERLERNLEDIKVENRELKEIRLLEVRNNAKILEQNNIKTELINSIEELVNSNKYNREDKILSKIKELVRDYQSNN